MKILVVARTFPWPADSGGRIRVANTIKALIPLGDVDLFVATRSADLSGEGPGAESVRRISVHPYPPSSLGNASRIRWFARSRLPLELFERDYSTVRREFADFHQGQGYDLVWISHLPTVVAVGRLPAAPIIVDVDDLRSDWHTTRLAAGAGGSGVARLTHQLNGLLVRRNAELWRRLESHIASRASATVVCSEPDRARLATIDAHVVPNGYDRPAHPVGRTTVHLPPTIVLPGGLHYPPNIDAARYLVERVLPRLRSRIPNVQVRLVGSAAPAVLRLASHEGVVVTGHVPNIEDELRLADLLAAPIRFGGGTRIKILEAFAHRIPVVAASLAAYGLDVVDGRHLRIADTPNDFADACVSLLADTGARRTLMDEAEALFLKSYQWCNIAGSIREVARDVARASEVENKGNNALAS